MRAEFAFDVCHDVYRAARVTLDGKLGTTNLNSRDQYLWRPDLRPHLAEYAADFALAGHRALRAPLLASRLAMFQVFHVGCAESQEAMKHLGVGEITWNQWLDEVRSRVGRELLQRGMFPPRNYFRKGTHAFRAA